MGRMGLTVAVAAGACAAAWGARLTSQSYVQDGLVVQFDGIDNVGVGQHDNHAATWRDLKGDAYVVMSSVSTWFDRGLDAKTTEVTVKGIPAFRLDSVGTELTMNRVSNGPSGYPRPMHYGDQDGAYSIYFPGASDVPQFFISGIGDPRPVFGSFSYGTLGMASDATNYRTYRDGLPASSSGTKTVTTVDAPAKDWKFNRQSTLHGVYRAFRHYNRPLTDAEYARNGQIDQFRFFSYSVTGTGAGTALPWATAGWALPFGRSSACPNTLTNDIVQIVAAKVSVTAADQVAVKSISLEDGAKLALADDAEVRVKVLWVECEPVGRGIYSGVDGTIGKKVDWIEGAGLVCVAGALGLNPKIPAVVPRLGAHSYVQDGLITQFDALDNEAKGEFNPQATNWRNHLFEGGMPFASVTAWKDGRYLHKNSGQVAIGPLPAFKRDSVTCECAVDIFESGNGYPRPFSRGESFSVYFAGSSQDAQVYINGQQPDTRPNLGKFRTGTVAILSGPTGYGGAVDGVVKAMTGVPVKIAVNASQTNWELGYGGTMVADYGALRLYNRRISNEELAWNTLIDKLRYFSWAYGDDGEQEPVAWADVAWQVPSGQTAAAPSATTNQYVSVSRATVAVAATDDVALAGLALDDHAKLAVAEGAVVSLKVLFVNGVQVKHGIYTGAAGAEGEAVDWIVGAGQVRVAGGLDRRIPSIVPAPDADGWYTFGLDNGSAGHTSIVGEHPDWDLYSFPAGSKLRLKGHVLMETVPDSFVEYDTTGLKCVYVNGTRAYAADRPFEVPAGAVFRFVPGTWKEGLAHTNTVSGVNATLMGQTTGDVTLAGNAAFHIIGDGLPNLTYGGCISGDGALRLGSYGRQMRFTGGFDVNAWSENWQNGSGVWVDTLSVTGRFGTVTLSGCGDIHGMTEWYSACFVMFGLNGSDRTADHPLYITRLNGNASSRVDDAGKRWRSGGHVLVWGSNTVHVVALHAGVHVVADRLDQHCRNGYLDWTTGQLGSKGIGFLEIDAFNSGTVYGSTNVEVTVGAMAAGTAFDFTYQSNAVNRLALDITGACAANTTVKATDLAMLPARLSGFAGTVTLTETEAKSYEMPIDFTAGLDGIYNPVGCNGSGTLAAAPATGTIDATFPTEDMEIEPGKYALARFSAGGDLLKNWTVTLNGERTSTARVGHHVLQVRKDATGIWLGVDLPAMTIILR